MNSFVLYNLQMDDIITHTHKYTRPGITVVFAILYFLCMPEAYGQNDSSITRINKLQSEHIIEPFVSDEMMVVSASRSAKKIEDLPVTIHVVTREEILKKGYVTLVDVLKSLPGIKVSQPGSAENGEMFQMRGLLGNQYTKILVNDIPIRPSVSTSVPLEAQLPIRQAERIEIIYGPSSAVYGADAAIGVINIITRKPSSKVFASADVNMGSGDQRYINFTAGGKAGRDKNILEYSFFGSFYDADNLDIFQDTAVYNPLSYLDQFAIFQDVGGLGLPSEIPVETFENNPGLYEVFFSDASNYEGTVTMPEITQIPTQSNLFGINLRYKKWELTYLSMYRKTHSSIGRTSFYYKYNSSENYIADYNRKFYLTRTVAKRKLTSKSIFKYSAYRFDENSNYGVNFLPNTTKAYQFSVAGDLDFEQVYTYNAKYVEVVGGFGSQFSMDIPMTNYAAKPYDFNIEIEPTVELVTDTINYEEFGNNPYAFVNGSAFLQFYLNLDKLKVVTGIRGEANSLFARGVLTPRIAVLYKLNKNHSFRISSGKAYKPPTGNQLFQSVAFSVAQNGSNDSIYYAFIPNLKLKPEYFTAHEFGYRGKFFNNKLSMDLALYYNSIEQMITLENVDARTIYNNAVYFEIDDRSRRYNNSNNERVNMYGIDASFWLHNIYEPWQLSFRVSNTYMYGSEKLANGESIPYLRGIPQHMLKFNVSLAPGRKTYFEIENTLMSSWKRSYLPEKDFYALNPDYAHIDGYFTTDVVFGYRIHKNLNAYIRIKNFFNEKYGGIDALGLDTDLRYNPQYGRTGQFGLSFIID